MSKTDLTRRTFLKATGAVGAAAAVGVGTCAVAPQASGAVGQALADEGSDERIVWSHCHVNCGGACVLRFHMVGDTIKCVESDNTGSAAFGDIQMRACLRGRSIRRWLDHPDRLNYPLKRREGTKRGEGVYDQITWDEALDTIASEFTRIKKTYGNEAIFIQECSGVEQNIMMNNPFFRLFNLLGGEVTRYGNYSNCAINFGSNPFTYGDSWGRRSFKSLQNNQLVVLFGDSVMDMRMGGDGAGYDLNVAMEKQGSVKGYTYTAEPAEMSGYTKLVLDEIDKAKSAFTWYEATMGSEVQDAAKNNVQTLISGEITAQDYMQSIQDAKDMSNL